MEKRESVAAASGLRVGSPGEAIRGVPEGVRGVHGPGSPLHSGNTGVRSPGSSRPSEGTGALGSVQGWHTGEVGNLSLECSTSAGGFNAPCPGTSTSRVSIPGPTEFNVYSSGCSSRSGSTCSNPRSILKNSSSILMQKPPSTEKKSQRWDEMNILATYHPADKDYGFTKVDEPKTPYHRLQDSDEDLSSHKMTPESLAERFATMDNFLPKVLQYGDNRSSKTADNFSKTHSSDFDKHRKAHYNEGKFLKAQKNLPLASEEDSSGTSASISSGIRNVTVDPKPRPLERGWARRLARGVKDEPGLVTESHDLDTKDASSCRKQLPQTSTLILSDQINLQRKEYYHKGRYLRSSSQPELEEDVDDEQQDSSTKSFRDSGSQVASSWCQWLGPKGLSCQSPGSSGREHGSNQNSSSRNGRRHETLRLQWTQEEEPRPWKM